MRKGGFKNTVHCDRRIFIGRGRPWHWDFMHLRNLVVFSNQRIRTEYMTECDCGKYAFKTYEIESDQNLFTLKCSNIFSNLIPLLPE